jgi:hypothetical protein
LNSINNGGDLASLFDQLINKMGDLTPIKKEANYWVESKKQTFSGQAYQEVLEKNAVYFVEATASTKQAITKYFHSGEPHLASEEIRPYVDYIGREIPQQQLELGGIVSFIRGDNPKKPNQASNWDWYKIKHLRENKNQQKYLNEMECICRTYQAATILADIFLLNILHKTELARIANNLPDYEVLGIVIQRIDWWANFATENNSDSNQQKKKWQFWK